MEDERHNVEGYDHLRHSDHFHHAGTPLQLAQKQYLQVTELASPQQCQIESINIFPKDFNRPLKTNKDLILKRVAPITQLNRLDQIFDKSQDIVHQLDKLGLFESVQIAYDAPQRPDSPLDSMSFNVILDEKKTQTFHIGAGMEGLEKFDVMLYAGRKNAFGNGETVTMQSNITLKDLQLMGLFVKPLYNYEDTSKDDSIIPVVGVEVSRSWKNENLYSKFGQLVSSISARLARYPHEITYGLAWRDLQPQAGSTMDVRRYAGDSLKSSISYHFYDDDRDCLVLPSRGTARHGTVEFAGIGGDVVYLKAEGTVQLNIPNVISIPNPFFQANSELSTIRNPAVGINYHLLMKGGILKAFIDNTSRINDRFFLGGIYGNAFRGFGDRGVEVNDKKESLGGDLYYLMAHFFTFPIPWLYDNFAGSTLQFFVNVGSLALRGAKETLVESFNSMIRKTRASVGAGIVLKLGANSRVEFNYCIPLLQEKNDHFKAWHWGISLEFL